MPELDPAGAQAELVRAWLSRFGPGTAADLQWWAGLPAGGVARALAAVGAVQVDLDGVTGYVLPDDVEASDLDRADLDRADLDRADLDRADLDPGCRGAVLLPALDPTVMGWQQRDWYLGGHAASLFDRTGNAGPTVWWGGRVIGGWGQRSDGEIAVRLLEDAGREARTSAEGAAADLRAWLQDVRIAPRARGRSPVEAEVTA
jgi:hypothetical protein